MSLVSRKYGIVTSVYINAGVRWMKAEWLGLRQASPWCPLSELKTLRVKVRDLAPLSSRKTIEVEILKESIELGREKTRIARPLAGRGGFQVKTIASNSRWCYDSVTMCSNGEKVALR